MHAEHRVKELASLVSRMIDPVGLPLLLLFLGAWGVRAIVLDQQPAFADTLHTEAVRFYLGVTRGNVGPLEPSYRPPLCFLPAALLFLITGPSLVVLRLTILAQYLALVGLVHSTALRLANRQAALFCAVLVGTFPMTFGWGRMSYADTGLSLMVVAALRVLVSCDFNRYRDGLKLGVVVGLGMLTKLAFPIFALGPLLWTLAYKVRRWRHLAVLGLSAASALFVISWWYLPNWSMVLLNLQMSGRRPSEITSSHEILQRLSLYTVEIEGVLWLFGLACVCGLAASALRVVKGRALVLLTLASWLPALLLLLFNPAQRYTLPVYPVMGLLAGISLQSVLARHGRRLSAMGLATLGAFLVAHYVILNLGYETKVANNQRWWRVGGRIDQIALLSPDHRPYDHYPRALRAAQTRFKRCLLLFNGVLAFEAHRWVAHHHRTEGPPAVRVVKRLERYQPPSGEEGCLLVVSDSSGNRWSARQQTEKEHFEICQEYERGLWVTRREKIGAWGPSPLGLSYSLYAVDPQQLSRAAARQTTCRLGETGIHRQHREIFESWSKRRGHR